jgi:hypothetical protein
MARRSSSPSDSGRSAAAGTAELPDDLRRRDLPDAAGTLANDDVSIGAHSPPPDGGSSDHPIHDEDLDDIEPEGYENLLDDIEETAVSQAKEGTHHLGEDTGEALIPLDAPLTDDELTEDEDSE